MGDRPGGHGDLQRQIDDLSTRLDGNRADIDALTARADATDTRSDVADQRMRAIEAASAVDREMIVELQAAGVVSQEHAAQMEVAQRSSRTIGAAIGMIMASRQVGDDEAFAILKGASQNSNRKLRDIAEDLVRGNADVAG
jgi:hypothetical protein